MTGTEAWFKSSKLKALTASEWDYLTVTGMGIQVTRALRTKGAETSAQYATIIISVEQAR